MAKILCPKLLNRRLALRGVRVSSAEVALLGYCAIVLVSGIRALFCSECVGEYAYTVLFW